MNVIYQLNKLFQKQYKTLCYIYDIVYIFDMLDKIKNSCFYKSSSKYIHDKLSIIINETSVGNGILYIYSLLRTNYPIAVCKINDIFMIFLKKFVYYCMNDDYSKNIYIKRIYDKFNNDDEYIEDIQYTPILKMDSLIIKSKTMNDCISKNTNDSNFFTNPSM